MTSLIIYLIPLSLAVALFLYARDEMNAITTKDLSEDAQKWKELLKQIAAGITVLTGFAFLKDVKAIQVLQDVITLVLTDFDAVVSAIGVVVAFGLSVYQTVTTAFKKATEAAAAKKLVNKVNLYGYKIIKREVHIKTVNDDFVSVKELCDSLAA